MPPLLFPAEMIEDTAENYLPEINTKSQVIYITVMGVLTAMLCALPFIEVDVSVQCAGIIRPLAEKTELRTLVAGTIDRVMVSDGQSVKEGRPLIRLADAMVNSRLRLNSILRTEKEQEIADLKMLTRLSKSGYDDVAALKSALYRQQYSRFVAGLADHIATQRKLQRDLQIKQQLYHNGKVISLQELENQQYEYDKAVMAFHTAFEQQLSAWQDELSGCGSALSQLRAEAQQLEKEKDFTVISAPVNGSLQQFQGKYEGSAIQAGDVLGIISPDSGMIVECYVRPADIGLLQEGMKANFQVDAFNYNEWGLAGGRIITISRDFLMVDNTAAFLVRCALDSTSLRLKNGYTGFFKKGMTVRARFTVTRRSLGQLLFDKADNWLNPRNSS